jgi:type II secretory pathway pseudopilin PulG
MTLIELVIALSLTIVVLSTVMFLYRQMDDVNRQLEKAQQENFRMRYLGNRLAAVLPQVVSEKTNKKDFYFFTSAVNNGLFKEGTPSLVFTFDNGVDRDKLYSNHNLARLYLDPQGNLTLASWPSTNDWNENTLPPMKKQVLMENVEDLHFGFFVAPDKEWKTKKVTTSPTAAGGADTISPEPQGSWIPEWKADYKQLPAMIRLEIRRQDRKTSEYMVFPLPFSQKQVVYTQ